MSVEKPYFVLRHVYDDGSESEPRVVPVSGALDIPMSRRGAFGLGAGLAGLAAFLQSCGADSAPTNPTSSATPTTSPTSAASDTLPASCLGIDGGLRAHAGAVQGLAVSASVGALASGGSEGAAAGAPAVGASGPVDIGAWIDGIADGLVPRPGISWAIAAMLPGSGSWFSNDGV